MYKLIINMKTYSESTGKNAIKLAKIVKSLEPIAKKKNVEIILCPQEIDIKDVIKEKVTTLSQHFDSKTPGSNTGWSILENLKTIGVKGSLISHSEHILEIKDIEREIKTTKELSLISCVCARDEKSAKQIAKFKPDYIAVEPKELIGGDISISTAKPELITNSLKAIGKNSKLLVGAGVKNSNDVKIAVELGAVGILVASGVVKANNQKEAILELLGGF